MDKHQLITLLFVAEFILVLHCHLPSLMEMGVSETQNEFSGSALPDFSGAQ